MVQHTERTLSLRSGKFQVRLVEGGTGPDLLYLHDTGGFTRWTPYLDRLAEEFRVVAPAQPGVPGSTGLEHLDDVWDLVLFYEELTQALGMESFCLVGHGFGGMVAAELAAHRPDRVSHLALIAPLGLWLPENPLPDIFALTLSQRSRLEWLDPQSETARAYLAEPPGPEERIEHELDRTQTAQSVGKFIWPIPDRGLIKRIHRVVMPTLLIWGQSDAVVPPVYAEAFNELLSNSRIQVISQCGHLPQLEQPEAFHTAIRSFFQE